MTLSLAPLGLDDLERVAHITVAAHQMAYSGTGIVAEAFADAE